MMTTATADHDTATDRKPFVFEIHEERFEKLVERFAKMVNRARKCKLPAPSFAVIHEVDEQVTRQVPDRTFDPTGMLGMTITEVRWVRYLYVTVEGDRPHLSGWDFIATVDHTEAGLDGMGNIIKSVPGAGEIPVAYRNAFPVCDHCHTARNRHETFIIRKADDATVTQQIGRNCLADFFPGLSPADVATQLAWWTEAVELLGESDEPSEGGYDSGQERYELESILTWTQAAIDAFGWTSRTKAKEGYNLKATADYVGLLFLKTRDLSERGKKELATMQEQDQTAYPAMIEAALAWVRAIDPETAEDYLYNLHTVCKGETVRSDRVGLACSLLPAYRRFVDGEREKREAVANPSEFVGMVGQRGLFAGCVLTHVSEPYESSFGTTTRLTFKQGANVLVWWASNPDGFEVDQTYDILGTPKKHEDYRNARTDTVTRQTIVNRVNVATDKDRKKYGKAK